MKAIVHSVVLKITLTIPDLFFKTESRIGLVTCNKINLSVVIRETIQIIEAIFDRATLLPSKCKALILVQRKEFKDVL